MNRDIFEGNWKKFKGDIQEKWGKLTDDQLDQINGNREKFYGELQRTYGIAREEAEEQLKDLERNKAA